VHGPRSLGLLLAIAPACVLGAPEEDGTEDGTDGGSSAGTSAAATSTAADTDGSTGVDPDGSTSTDVDGSSSTGDDGGPLGCPDARTEVDRPDDSPDAQVRVLYVVPADGADAQLDVDGTICNSVASWSAWLDAQTGGRRLRLDTHDGALDIGFVRLALDDAQMHGTSTAQDIDTGVAYVRDRIERELLQDGHLVPGKIYAVYYGGTSEYACGGGAFPPMLPGVVGAMYLGGEIPGYPPCDEAPWGQPDLVPRYIDSAMLHELMHTLGHVAIGSPSQHSFGHAFDEGRGQPQRDLLYSPRPGTDDPPWGVYEPGGLVLDLGRDDYFEHGDPSRPDLARSIYLDPLPPDAEPPP